MIINLSVINLTNKQNQSLPIECDDRLLNQLTLLDFIMGVQNLCKQQGLLPPESFNKFNWHDLGKSLAQLGFKNNMMIATGYQITEENPCNLSVENLRKRMTHIIWGSLLKESKEYNITRMQTSNSVKLTTPNTCRLLNSCRHYELINRKQVAQIIQSIEARYLAQIVPEGSTEYSLYIQLKEMDEKLDRRLGDLNPNELQHLVWEYIGIDEFNTIKENLELNPQVVANFYAKRQAQVKKLRFPDNWSNSFWPTDQEQLNQFFEQNGLQYDSNLQRLAKAVFEITINGFNAGLSLLESVQKNNSELFELALFYGADVNYSLAQIPWGPPNQRHCLTESAFPYTEEKYETPLMRAIRLSRLDMVNILIRNPATTFNYRGHSLFEQALWYRDKKILKILTEHTNPELDINEIDARGNPLLSRIISTNHDSRVVKNLLRRGVLVNIPGCQATTALMLATIWGYEETFKKLLSYKANVNMSDTRGNTALIYAVNRGETKMVKTLLEYKAKVDDVNQNGHTALIQARKFYSEDHKIIELLLSAEASLTRLHQTDTKNYQKKNPKKSLKRTAEKMIEEPSGNESKNRDGFSNSLFPAPGLNKLLLEAAKTGNKKKLQLALQKGADINWADEEGCTALILAAQEGHLSILNILLQGNGIKVNHQDNQSYTALMIAVIEGHYKIVEILLSNGVDVHLTEENGNTALMLAADNKDHAIVDLLMRSGANPAIMNKEGETVTSEARLTQDFELLSLLEQYPKKTGTDSVDNESKKTTKQIRPSVMVPVLGGSPIHPKPKAPKAESGISFSFGEF